MKITDMNQDKITEELLAQLNHANKNKRREALDIVNSKIYGDETKLSISEIDAWINIFEVPIISRLSDKSEINRSKAYNVMKNMLQKGVKRKSLMSYLIPTLYHQMGKTPIIEECEENILECLVLIDLIIDCYGCEIQMHINDICAIIISGLQDNCPEIVLKACDCIQKLPVVTDAKFQMFSSQFMKPLLRCITKHRLKIRVKSINTLECIFTFGSSQNFGEVNDFLEKCIFDIPQVRAALLSYASTLCMKMTERYSFWSMLLPFILFGLRDDDDEIRKSAILFWDKIGSQYTKENKDIKQSILELKTDLPPLRFNEGCCALIERSFHRMLEKICTNSQSWQADVKFQALTLLTTCVCGLRENSVQYSNKIIDLLTVAVNDRDQRIGKECLLCAEYLGEFVPPSLYIPLLEPSLWHDSAGCASLLSALTRGTPPERLQPSLSLFVRILSLPDRTLSLHEQEHILSVMRRLFSFTKFECFQTDLFFTLFYVIGSRNESIESMSDETSLGVLKLASTCCKTTTVECFINENMKDCFSRMKDSPKWEREESPEIVVFQFLSQFEGFANHLEEISSLLKMKIDYRETPLVAYIVFQVLKDALPRINSRGHEALTREWSVYLLREHICQFLSWTAGQTGENLRLGSISSLIFVLQHSGLAHHDVYEGLQSCLKHISALASEDVVETRICVCSFIDLYCSTYCTFFDHTEFFDLMKLPLTRLDDDDGSVRRVAARTLESGFGHFPEARKHSERVKAVMSHVQIYLHDEDGVVQEKVSELLKLLGDICPDHLHQILNATKYDSHLTQKLENLGVVKENKIQ